LRVALRLTLDPGVAHYFSQRWSLEAEQFHTTDEICVL